MPRYPRWARAVALPVSCYRVVRVEARTPFVRGRLAVQRHTPRVPEDFSSGCRGRSLGLGGSVPFYRVCIETSSAVLDCLSLSWVLWPFHLIFTCPFRSDGGLVCRAHSGLGRVAGRAPSLCMRGPSGILLTFYTPLTHEGLFAEAPLGASPGRGVSAFLQEEPPSPCIGREGRQGLP